MKGTPVGGGYRRIAKRAGVGAAIASIAIAAGAGEASANKYQVTTKKPDGAGSLVAAVKKTRKNEGGDKITFAKNLRGKIDLPDTLTLKGKITIAGNGYGDPENKAFKRLELSGHRGESAIEVEGGANASLRELFTKGVIVRADESRVTIKDSFLDGQGTTDATGVSTRDADGLALRILHSTITGFDGGVAASTDARIDQSTIADNVGRGGVQVGREADISNSTIAGNVVDSGYSVNGGGINAYSGSTRVTNTTITRNQAIGNQSAGGGVFGDVTLLNSTVSSNRASSGAGVAGGSREDVDASNSIIYGNVTFGSEASDCARGFTSNGGNLIGEPGDCLLDPSDLSGVDPLLGQLKDNGGPTQTQAIAVGSPAIGLAVDATATKFDQRGVTRGSDPDAGAYERKG